MAPDVQVGEIQQVEQSSDQTNSVNGIGIKISETDPVKGKEVTTKRGTRPPLNFLAILNDANITLDTSFPEELCNQLYAGVFLEPNKLKYFVDKKLNKNCFILFARKLYIGWSDHSKYWNWTKEKDTGGEDIEVAELLEVCWLDIQGTILTIDLSPGTVYEVVFVVKMKDKGQFNYSVNLTIVLPRSKRLTRHENLNEKPLGKWIEIQVGEFIMSPENVGDLTFKLDECSSDWKRGLVMKCAIIRPKSYCALGMQIAVIDFARSVLGLKDANSTEFDPNTRNPCIVFMPEGSKTHMGCTMRLGSRRTYFQVLDCKSAKLYGSKSFIDERHRHRYEENPDMVVRLEKAGLLFTGKDETGRHMEIIELPNHPYFVGVQFHPEFKSRPGKPSPLFLGLIAAACGELDAVLPGYGSQRTVSNGVGNDTLKLKAYRNGTATKFTKALPDGVYSNGNGICL